MTRIMLVWVSLVAAMRLANAVPVLGLDIPKELVMDVNKPYAHRFISRRVA